MAWGLGIQLFTFLQPSVLQHINRLMVGDIETIKYTKIE